MQYGRIYCSTKDTSYFVFIDSFIFMPNFSLGRVAGAAGQGEHQVPDGQQQSQTVLLAPLRDGTKQGRR